MTELFFDTETTGLVEFKEPYSSPSQPHLIQLGAVLSTEEQILAEVKIIVNPTYAKEWYVEELAEATHGISKEQILQFGVPTKTAGVLFSSLLSRADTVVCHNTQFDVKLIASALYRVQGLWTVDRLLKTKQYCTMQRSTDLLKIPFTNGGTGYKWPRLIELHHHLFNEAFDGAHDALEDVRACRRCYYEMRRRGL